MKNQKELRKNYKIITLPTLLNISRVVLTFVVIYMIIVESNVVNIVVVFVIAALTDWFDGKIARKYNLVNEFGRKADVFADRFLWVGTAIAFLVFFGLRERLNYLYGIQLLLIMIREIITAPFAIAAFFSGVLFQHTRYIAKLTTFIQGFALPALLLSVYYHGWSYFSIPLSIVLGVIGFISGLYYIRDVNNIK